MFGITTGKTTTTFEPTGTVSRQDMARFIHRMFVPASVAAAGATTVPTFTDTAHVTADGLAAIDALASHGITTGKTATTFAPDDNVTREEMAMFLNRFASIAKDHAGAAITAIAASTGIYNYSDIAATSWEGMESIIRLYNLGVTGETCTSLSLSTCATTYRPAADITRAEMAGMLTALLNHTNARPAGTTIQSDGSAAAAGTKNTLASVRSATFTPTANALVDVFHQVHNDLVPAAAFHAVLGTCTATIVVGVGTECSIDAADGATNVYGNVAGTSAALANNTTLKWWAHSAADGTAYVNGVTAGGSFTMTLGAAATTTYATTATASSSVRTGALVYNTGALSDNVTDTDGKRVPFGEDVTMTVTFTNAASTAAVVDGYYAKFVQHRVDDAGNVAISTSYVASSGGAASITIASGTDALPAVVGGATNYGNWESVEVTVTLAPPTGVTNYYPAGGSAISGDTIGSIAAGGLNFSWSDAAAAFTAGTTLETLTLSDTMVVSSTAGTIVDATAKAHDQYGRGITGKTATFIVGGADKSTLTTSAAGTAVYSFVACAASLNGTTTVAINASSNFNGIAATGANHGGVALVPGTTIYCSRAATDALDAAKTNTTGVNTIQTITSSLASALASGTFNCSYLGQTTAAMAYNIATGDALTALNLISTLNITSAVYAAGPPSVWTVTHAGGASALITCAGTASAEAKNAAVAEVQVITWAADPTSGNYTITLGASDLGAGGVIGPFLHSAASATIHGAINALAGYSGVACVSSGTNTVETCTFLATQGQIAQMVVDEANTGGVTLSTTATESTTTQGVSLTNATFAGVKTTAGTVGNTLDIFDFSAAGNTMVAANVNTDAGIATTTYITYTWDSGDSFSTATVTGATETQWEAYLAGLLNTTTNLTVGYRTGALTTGVSSFVGS
jgi:hypothetical protein